MLTLILYFVIFSVVGIAVFYGLVFGAMFMKIPKRKLEEIIKLGKLRRTTRVLDLGAGLGTIAFTAAYEGSYVTAVERNPILVGLMKMMLFYNRRSVQTPASHAVGVRRLNVEIVKANLLDVDYSKADVIYCYLFPPLMQAVGEKAKREMKRGSKLISVEHKIERWKPTFEDKKEKVYVYTAPTSFCA
jgi:SAM-dependent methyltransferase